MLEPGDLVVTGSTLGNPPFETLVRAAAEGGFKGLSLWPRESYFSAREAGFSDADLRTMLDDHGVVVNDVDALMLWLGAGEAPLPGPPEDKLFEAGEALGARLLNVVMMSPGPASVELMAERFAGVADRAAEHGLRAHLEFVPFMAVPDATTAWRVVELAGRPNTGIMVDSWHCFRGATTEADLRAIPGDRVLGVQLNDAPAEPMENPIEETLHHRLLPGEGAIDLAGLVGLLRERGCPAPFTAEVFSDDLIASGTPFEIARRVGDAMRALCLGE
jgi:sugar phosphate isomerase/epimerase